MDKLEQLITLLKNNPQPTWEIEAVHQRCYIYYGSGRAVEECQQVIDFASLAGISLLESFRLQVEISELSAA